MTDARIGGRLARPMIGRLARRGPVAPVRVLNPERMLDFAAYLLFVCFIYKLSALAVLVLLGIVGLGLLRPIRVERLGSLTALVAIAYIASATLTAFMVDMQEGIYRSVVFAAVVSSSLVLANHFAGLDLKRGRRVVLEFSAVVALIYAHMVIYHVSIGRMSSWKLLYDTKTVISLAIVLLFYFEDTIKRRLPLAWLPAVLGIAALTVLSGERKAYVLLAFCFMLSRASVFTKVLIPAAGALFLTSYLVAAPADDYVAKQVLTLLSPAPHLHISEYYLIDDIQYRSDLIREFVNTNARALFWEHPVFGVGATGYEAWARMTFGDFAESRGLSTNVHGEINRVPVESGILGILVSLACLGLVAWNIVRHMLRTRNRTSQQRTPVYLLLFVLTYTATEAMDTSMQMLILCFALYSDNLGSWARNSRRRRPEPHSRLSRMAPAVARNGLRWRRATT